MFLQNVTSNFNNQSKETEMQKNSIYALATITLFVISAFYVTTQNPVIIGPIESNGPHNHVLSAYVTHPAIVITHDDNFTTQGFTGSGTAEEPYVIENLNITVDDDDCVNITNTRAHFVIQNCLFQSLDSMDGTAIMFENVSYGCVIDCQTTEAQHGFVVEDSSDCTLDNLSISNGGDSYFLFSFNITLKDSVMDNCNIFYITNSNNCTCKNDTISNCRTGIILTQSEFVTIVDCEFVGNNILIQGNSAASLNHNITGNTVNGMALGFIYSESDKIINGSTYGSLILAMCTNVTIRSGDFSETDLGVEIVSCTNCLVEDIKTHEMNEFSIIIFNSDNTTIQNSYFYTDNQDNLLSVYSSPGTKILSNHMVGVENYALGLVSCPDSEIIGNLFVDCYASISCVYSDNSIIANNTVFSGSEDSIWYQSSINIHLVNNTLIGCAKAITLWDIDSSYIINNTISVSSDQALFLNSQSEDNVLYGNKLGWNYINAKDDGVNNTWDNSIDFGNYWSDYSPPGVYNISGSADAVDRYPSILIDNTPPIIDHPNDIEFDEGMTGNIIHWNPFDFYPDDHRILRNGSIIAEMNWYGEPIEYVADTLATGIWNITLVVYDKSGNTIHDSIFVHVIGEPITTTTTTTTTTSTTTTSTSTTNTTGETTPQNGIQIELIILVSGGLIAVVAIILIYRNKTKT